MAKLILKRRRIHENGAIEERIIWKVPETSKYPDGVRYRLVYILKPKKKPIVLYDNHYPKGHHRHFLNREMPYEYSSIEKLVENFNKDIEEAKKYVPSSYKKLNKATGLQAEQSPKRNGVGYFFTIKKGMRGKV